MTIPKNIQAEALKLALKKQTTILLDVRTDAEYTHEHIPGSYHIPLDAIAEHKQALANSKQPVTFICRSGKRATEACKIVKAAGLKNATILDGGVQAWTAANGETIKSNKWSLERQVRAVAGLFVVTSVVLAFTVHPSWALVGGAVGAGLLFSGVTDTCGMALLLARMPWNQSRVTNTHAEIARIKSR